MILKDIIAKTQAKVAKAKPAPKANEKTKPEAKPA